MTSKKIDEMLSKLDSLKAKKEELVRERDSSKKEAEEIRVKMGFDLLNGVQIDKAGEALSRTTARIETLNSAINAVASTYEKVDKELKEEQRKQALIEVEELGVKADALALDLFKRLADIAVEAKELTTIENKARSLGVGSAGFSMRHNTGLTLKNEILLTLKKLRNVDGSIQTLILKVE